MSGPTKTQAQYKLEQAKGYVQFNRYSPTELAVRKREIEALEIVVQTEALQDAWDRATDPAKVEFIRRNGELVCGWRIA